MLLFALVAWSGTAFAAPAADISADLRSVLAGVFAAIGLYHLALWNRLRELREYLWFGLVALGLGFDAHLTSGGMEMLPPSVYTRLLAANFHGVVALFPVFVWSILGHELGRALRLHVVVNAVLAVLMALFGSEPVFAMTGPVRLVALVPMASCALFITVRDAWQGHGEARFITLGGVPMFIAAVHDRWVELHGVVGAGWSSVAFGLFVLGMALLLADRFGRTYTESRERQRQLAELNRATERFVPFRLLQLLGKQDIREVSLGEGSEREITVMFTDIRDFTSLSEQMTPSESFGFINDYLGHMEPCVDAAGGFIDKFIGDAVMAIFPAEPRDAVRASLAMFEALETFNQQRVERGEAPIEIGIGINTGPCILGTIGGPSRMDGTVISDAVNLAARVESMSKHYAAPLVITEMTAARLGGSFSLREVDRVAVKGRSEPVALFEVLDAEDGRVRRAKEQGLPRFQQALADFRRRRFAVASEGFRACLADCPDDGVAVLYLERCAWLSAHDPGPDWDGVVRMVEK